MRIARRDTPSVAMPHVATLAKLAVAQLLEASGEGKEVYYPDLGFIVGLDELSGAGVCDLLLRLVVQEVTAQEAHVGTCVQVGHPAKPIVLANGMSPLISPSRAGIIPHWNRSLGLLMANGRLIKCLHERAANQRAVLSALQRRRWAWRIPDPLPPPHDPERLHDTIKSLNAGQLHQLLRFRGDGTGRRIIWEWIDSMESR